MKMIIIYDWEDFLAEINTWMNKHPGPYIVKGTGMGWRRSSGITFINVDGAEDFVSKVTPKTSDFTFKMYQQDGKFYGSISHHDAPTGEGREFIPVPKARLTVRQLKEFFKKYSGELRREGLYLTSGLTRDMLMEKFCAAVNVLQLHDELNTIL